MARRRIDAVDGYAVVRLDWDLLPGSAPADDGPGSHFVTVKEVLVDLDEAKREVARLNELNSAKGCRYYWQSTRIFLDGGSFGPRTSPKTTTA